MDVPQARRLTAPSWINARSVLGLLLFAAAWFGAQQVVNDAESTVRVWAAATDLGQDAVIDAEDLTAVDVHLPSDVVNGYVLAARPLEGWRVSRPLREGELISSAWLVDAASVTDTREISVPVIPEHAVGGRLRPGDRVDVYATFDAGDVRARTVVVVRAAEIVDMTSSEGVVLGVDAVTGVTLAVDTHEAARLAFALQTAAIDVVKVVGSADATGSSSVRLGDFP